MDEHSTVGDLPAKTVRVRQFPALVYTVIASLNLIQLVDFTKDLSQPDCSRAFRVDGGALHEYFAFVFD
jgi:hypothetical protein